ncbi:hypothetical protein IE81DRAFT_174120 [Ceraceosorus guamensis]|uniref:Uncharacterized protein n=1 Tax=Ceraceosorus guamensis TaxID=1522189 RepID=A0A316W1F6_9BASI|nr:hypothetical protein IE81DRAFT_174120 [Ceraceosorus guamensis]PWN41495.1 hypothetical protein IE81DRAFT_174120 [Ceraceosorus guamensis]
MISIYIHHYHDCDICISPICGCPVACWCFHPFRGFKIVIASGAMACMKRMRCAIVREMAIHTHTTLYGLTQVRFTHIRSSAQKQSLALALARLIWTRNDKSDWSPAEIELAACTYIDPAQFVALMLLLRCTCGLLGSQKLLYVRYPGFAVARCGDPSRSRVARSKHEPSRIAVRMDGVTSHESLVVF